MPIRFGGPAAQGRWGEPTADEKALTTILRTGQLPPARGSFEGSGLIARLLAGSGEMGTDSELGSLTLDDLLAMGLDGGGGGGGGGGGSFGSSQAGIASSQQFDADQAQLMRDFEASQADKQREFESQNALEELKARRLQIFSEMRNAGDMVGAVLFAMGIGDEDGGVGGPFADLPPMAGAQAEGKRVESGLEALMGGKINIGKGGVEGLKPAIKSATAFSAGQAPGGKSVGNLGDSRTLMESAYKVGTKKGGAGPGMSREEMLRKIASVTPQGAF